jgi:uncharacterized protein
MDAVRLRHGSPQDRSFLRGIDEDNNISLGGVAPAFDGELRCGRRAAFTLSACRDGIGPVRTPVLREFGWVLFQNTRLRSIRVPFHVNFEEVNLRFYVRRGDRRGVVFIREIVPRRALQLVAKHIYGEPYVTAPMRHELRRSGEELAVNYGWRMGGRWHQLQTTASSAAAPVPHGSEEEFITEHYWGYTARRGGWTSEYEVSHPRWNVYEVKSHSVDVDFSVVYGERLSCLNGMEPYSVLLAEGSEILVRSGTRLEAEQERAIAVVST